MPVTSFMSGFVGESPKKTSPVFHRSDRHSHAPFHPGVDMDLIHPAGDNGTVTREEELSGNNDSENGMLFGIKIMDPLDRFRSEKKGSVIRESELPHSNSGDFRHGIDADECRCVGDSVCIKCCTHKDLLGIPEELKKLIRIDKQHPNPKVFGSEVTAEFDLWMPRHVAENLGFMK